MTEPDVMDNADLLSCRRRAGIGGPPGGDRDGLVVGQWPFGGFSTQSGKICSSKLESLDGGLVAWPVLVALVVWSEFPSGSCATHECQCASFGGCWRRIVTSSGGLSQMAAGGEELLFQRAVQRAQCVFRARGGLDRLVGAIGVGLAEALTTSGDARGGLFWPCFSPGTLLTRSSLQRHKIF